MTIISTATSADEAARAAGVAVLPVGSFEQHGAYLPLATDTLVACAIARSIADAYNLLLLPPVTISCSHEHTGWTGTVSIRASTLSAVVADIADSLQTAGVQQLVVVNGHGGNYVLSNVVQEANVGGRRMALYPGRHDWDTARTAGGLASTAHDDMHAGEIETSLLLHVYPDVVRDGYQQGDHVVDRPHLLLLGMAGYTTSGVIGRPSLGNADKGGAVLGSLTATFADTLHALRHGSASPHGQAGDGS